MKSAHTIDGHQAHGGRGGRRWLDEDGGLHARRLARAMAAADPALSDEILAASCRGLR